MPARDQPILLAVSRGTASRDGRAAVAGLIGAVARTVPGVRVQSGFVDAQVPKIRDLVRSVSVEDHAVVVPLLLSSGYDVHSDITDALRSGPEGVLALARPLGPDDRLVSVLRERLLQAGATSRDRIVLASAGSGDPRAVADCRETARRLGRLLGVPVAVGFLAASQPTVSDAVRVASADAARLAGSGLPGGSARATSGAAAGRPRVIVASYILSPGYYYDLLRVSGADVIAPPLLMPSGPVPQGLVELVADRYREAAFSLVGA